MNPARHWAVIPAAGSGTRMGAALPKQYLNLAGRQVMEHTLVRFLHHPDIHGVVVVLSPGDPHWPRLPVSLRRRVRLAPGGAERYHSVRNGLAALAGEAAPHDWVLVHDAARPCLRGADLERLIIALAGDAVGGLLAVPVRDTMKRAGPGGRVTATVERAGLWHALTPQMFRHGLLLAALEAAIARGLAVTDEAAAMEAAGHEPRLVQGHGDNLKITRPEDLILAEFYLRQLEEQD